MVKVQHGALPLTGACLSHAVHADTEANAHGRGSAGMQTWPPKAAEGHVCPAHGVKVGQDAPGGSPCAQAFLSRVAAVQHGRISCRPHPLFLGHVPAHGAGMHDRRPHQCLCAPIVSRQRRAVDILNVFTGRTSPVKIMVSFSPSR